MKHEKQSLVEQTLLAQKAEWAKISERTMRETIGEIPQETPRRIFLFGVGSSHFASQLTGSALLRSWVRTKSQIFACQSLDVGTRVFPTKGDWCLGFTHRGKTPATLKALQYCEKMGAYTMLLTGELPQYEVPPFVKLHMRSSTEEVVEPHTKSVTGAICAATTLLLGNEVHDEWQRLGEEMNPSFEQCAERVAGASAPTWILGEYEGEWLAREISLKLMEMAFVQSKAFGTEEFFHGPRYAYKHAGAKDTIWHFSTENDARNDDLKATLRISVDTQTSPVSFVSALIEAQWLTLAVALKQGVDPDSAGKL